MGQSLGGAFVLLALVACVSLCCPVLGDPAKGQSDEITLGFDRIFIKLENGATYSVMVEPDYTVTDLFYQLQDNEGLPNYGIRLEYEDTPINYTAKLCDYNVQAGSTLNMFIGENSNYPLTFKVRTPDDREMTVTTQIDNTVASLKQTITELTGIPQVEQRLLVENKELKDDRRLINYRIYREDSVVHLGTPLEYCRREVTIFVRTLSGATIKVAANMADTVDGLKEKISKITGVPSGVLRLFNKRGDLITGEDHLCNFEFLPGPIVHMYFYSTRIASLDQVARLRAEKFEAHSIDPDKGAIFREVEDDTTTEDRAGPPSFLYNDARNWIPREGRPPTQLSDLFDPTAYLATKHDLQEIEEFQKQLESLSYPDASEEIRDQAMILRARIKLSTAVMPYRDAGDLKWFKQSGHYQGITLGGGILDVIPEQQVPLGADVNYWAPDGFSDPDLMRLFEVAERVRQVVASKTQTSYGVLGIASQRRINQVILFSYIVALAGYSPSVEFNQEIEGEECGFCRDDLTVEPAIRLPCQHTFHADCLFSWLRGLYHVLETMKSSGSRLTRCANCRRGFMFPYEAVGKAELETPELRRPMKN